MEGVNMMLCRYVSRYIKKLMDNFSRFCYLKFYGIKDELWSGSVEIHLSEDDNRCNKIALAKGVILTKKERGI